MRRVPFDELITVRGPSSSSVGHQGFTEVLAQNLQSKRGEASHLRLFVRLRGGGS